MSSSSNSLDLTETVHKGTKHFNNPLDRYDVVIRFLSAENLPKMDTIGHADPYIIAKMGDEVTYTSSVIPNTASPKWNDEEWIVRNIPITAKLFVVVFDKDDEKLRDDYIGQFEVINLINYHAPDGGHEIIDVYTQKNRGRFHLAIQSIKTSEEFKQLPPYTFDGPCRYTRHDSLAVGRLTMLNADCVYSTWKLRLRRISVFFDPQQLQHWNKDYTAAKAIFGHCPLSLATQSSIKLAHRGLFRRTIKHNDDGRFNSANDLWQLAFIDQTTKQIKPCVYTYIIDDNMWRFSETGNTFFTDFASKHALLANCSKCVRYAGEFHPQPRNGWDSCSIDDEWELVFDNGSGTYAPSADLLTNLKELLLFNFPGLNIVTYEYSDPKLKESREELKRAIEKYKRGTGAVEQAIINTPTPL